MSTRANTKVVFVRSLLSLLTIATVIGLVESSLVSAIAPNAPGDLAISVFVAESPAFIKEWLTTPSSHGPTIRRLRELRFNQQAHAGFIVTGYTQQENRGVNFAVDVEVIDPKGRIILQQKDWALHKRNVPAERSFILADPLLDLVIEPTDPSGKYQMNGTVRDLVAGKSARGMWEIEVKP
jgi:hypothetical protein